MEIAPTSCPSCNGTLEEMDSYGQKLYRCFICRWQITHLRYLDSQRWWGAFHLPLLTLWYNPRKAFDQLRANPVIGPAFLFFLISTALRFALQGPFFLFKGTSYGDFLGKVTFPHHRRHPPFRAIQTCREAMIDPKARQWLY